MTTDTLAPSSAPAPPFSVASYNVLATAYIQPGRYPRTPSLLLHPTWRIPALVHCLVSLDADVLCLQEVERDTFAAFQARLRPLGYVGQYARKQGGKPDGCATFYRQERFALHEASVLSYTDGQGVTADSGHIALLVLLRTAGGLLGIVNTHLTWDPPGTPCETQRGYRQMAQLLTAYGQVGPQAQGWIVCGDFNVTPDSAVVAALEQAGFHYAHAGLADTYTCNTNARAKMIDYLFYTSGLRARPLAVPRVDDQTPLPSAHHPSDHVPIMSQFAWHA